MIACVKVHDLLKGEDDGPQPYVLVDRLWPRGIAKKDMEDVQWLKNVAPSSELRKDFNAADYKRELDQRRKEGDEDVAKLLKMKTVTLVYASADREHNHARVLKSWLEDQ